MVRRERGVKGYFVRRRSSWVFAGAILVVLYFVFARYIDWWLYHAMPHRTERKPADVSRRIKSSGLPVQIIGKPIYAGREWHIEVVSTSRKAAKRRACIFGGIHGNEPAGTEAALTLVELLARNPLVYPSVDFVVVPLVNPWGWAHGLRHNGNNVDVAHSFVRGNTDEALAVRKLLSRVRCDLIIDLHEDRMRRGTYLVTYENPDIAVAHAVMQDIAKKGVSLSGPAPHGVYHIRETEFSSLERPTLSLYARSQGTALSYIVETPSTFSLPERVRVQGLILERLIGSLGN